MSAPVIVAREVPLFPLPDTVLFPGQRLPLHIFEPRYRAMARDLSERAAERKPRPELRIAMALLRPGWEADYAGRPPVHSIVGVGRVDQITPLLDGRYNLLLTGVGRARVVSEYEGGEYRVAELELLGEDESSAREHPAIVAQLRTICQALAVDARLRADALRELKDLSRPLGLMADSLAAASPLTGLEKRQLLEETDAPRRAQLLTWALGKRLRGFLSLDEARGLGKKKR